MLVNVLPACVGVTAFTLACAAGGIPKSLRRFLYCDTRDAAGASPAA